LRDLDITLHFGNVEARLQPPRLEDRDTKLRDEAPGAGTAAEQVAVPAAAVSVMRGKKAARAAPILALAARKARSACRMSGRRVRVLDGTPAGSSATAVMPSGSSAGSHSAGSAAPASNASAFSSCATTLR
jgi:hypothetical protein